ncbi:MAG TPA: Vps62-related protein [Pyrinomonadaceae bacterium]|nr:Vps62-related protein [Pyrinomonadaceae bacterium]
MLISGPPIQVIRASALAGTTRVKGEPQLLYSTTSSYGWLYNDSGSGASMDVSIYRPSPSDSTYFILGDYAQGNYNPPVGSSIIVKPVDDDPNFPLIKLPKDYTEVWNDRGSGGDHDGSIWWPVAPDGYISIGFVCQTGYSKPSLTNYACVRKDLCLDTTAGSLIWNDKNSGADNDVSLYLLNGVSSSFVAQPSYDPYTGPAHKLKLLT